MKYYITKSLVGIGLLASIGAASAGDLTPETRFSTSLRNVLQQDDWLQYQHLSNSIWHWHSLIDNPYLGVWSHRMTSRLYTPEQMKHLLDTETMSIDRERVRLALALDYLETARQEQMRLLSSGGDVASKLYNPYWQVGNLLSEVNPEGLIGSEYTQWLVARAYVLMAEEGRDLAKARALLLEATKQSDPWAERALLYLAILEDADGNTTRSLELLKGHNWSLEFAPEALYQRLVIGHSVAEPTQILQEIQAAMRRYPQLNERPRLIGALGITYYRLKDWKQTQKTLSSLAQRSNLLPTEAYALGGAYYGSREYTAALPLFERVATSDSLGLATMSQFALGNIYADLREYNRAKLAYTSVVESREENIPKAVSEEALYRLIELNFASGYDAFGGQTRLVERFLSTYPKSTHLQRVLELVKSYCYISTDYAATLNLIDDLERRGVRLGDVRQEVLVRYANTLSLTDEQFIRLLDEAVALGPGADAYTIALIMRAKSSIAQKSYSAAERNLQIALRDQSLGARYDSGVAYYLLGYAQYNQRNYMAAFKSFDTYRRGDGAFTYRADALTRMGDCVLSQGRSLSNALDYYRQAVELSESTQDEAQLRVVGILGLQGNYSQQAIEADKFMAQYAKSNHLPEVMYLKGKALSLSQASLGWDDALALYARIETEYPSSVFAPLAALERALIYSSEGDVKQAIPAYKRVVEVYPSSVEARTALSDLKTLYSEVNRLDEYVVYARGLDRALLPADQNIAHLSFLGLQTRIKRGEKEALSELQQWILTHPDSPELYDAQLLLVTTYNEMALYADALSELERMNKVYTAAEKQLRIYELIGQAHEGLGNLEAMTSAYQRAYTLARGDNRRSIPLAKKLGDAAYRSGAYALTVEITSEVLALEQLTIFERESLTLIKAKAQEQQKAIKGAIDTYATLDGSYMTEQGAEAAVCRAQLMLRLGQAKQVETLLENFISSGTPQKYWLARGFITLSDSYARQGEVYLAVQYLKNLQESYKAPEADIVEMTAERLNKLQK